MLTERFQNLAYQNCSPPQRILIHLALIVGVALIVTLPFLLSWYKVGTETIFGSFAADSMVYLAITRHTVEHGFFTFNQETMTNGFHPLWQYLQILIQLAAHLSTDGLLMMAFILSLIGVAGGFLAITRGVLLYWGVASAFLLPLLIVPGLFTLFFEPSMGHDSKDSALLYSFTSWAFVNGVESPATIFSLGLFVLAILSALAKQDENEAGKIAFTSIYSWFPRIALGMIVLSRTDDIFIFGGMALSVLMFQPGSFLVRVRDIFIISLPAMVAVILYMVYNYANLGIPLPASGLTKTDLALTENINHFISVLRNFDATRAARLIPMLTLLAAGGFTFLLCSLWALRVSDSLSARYHALLIYLVIPLAGYVFLKSMFQFVLVGLWHQGWWYYAGQIFTFNFLLGVAICQMLTSSNLRYLFAVFILSVVCLVQIIDTGHRITQTKGYASTFYKLWSNKSEINRALLAIDPDMKIIDNTDGLYSFMLDMPAGLGTGLQISTEEERAAVAEKGIVRAFYDRGFTVIPIIRGTTWEGHYKQQPMLDRLQFAYEEIYHDPVSGVGFYRLRYKPDINQ